MNEDGRQMVAVTSDRAMGSWRVLLRPAGPAAELEARLSNAVGARFDRAQPDMVLDLEVTAREGLLPEGAADLVRLLFGCDAAAHVEAGTSAMVDFDPEQSPTASHLRRLLVLAAHERDLPAPSAADLAREFAELSDAVAPVGLQRLLHHYALTCAARAAYQLRQLGDRDSLRLPLSAGICLDEAAAVVVALLGGDLGPLPGYPADATPGRVRDMPQLDVDPNVELELATVQRGRGKRLVRGVSSVELVEVGLAVGLVDVEICGEDGVHQVTGRVVSTAGGERVPESYPRLWVRAMDTGTGALLYEAQCRYEAVGFRADLYAHGKYGEDFWLDFTHDITSTPTGPGQVRSERARRVGVSAAGLQEKAASEHEWVEVARLWEQSMQLWRLAGDPARRALSAVHAIRAYRAAGPGYDYERTVTEREARAVMSRLSPGWSAPDHRQPAVADPLQLGNLLRTAKLTPHLNTWVVRSLDEVADDARRSTATRSAEPIRRPTSVRAVEELTDLAADSDRAVRSASARARVALAVWAARTGRRRLAHSILIPVAIDFALLDDRGRRELAEANALLAGPPDLYDPDDVTAPVAR